MMFGFDYPSGFGDLRKYVAFRKAFSKFSHRHYELISKLNVGLKSL